MQRRRRRKALATAAGCSLVLGALGAAAPAPAKLPKPRTTLIVPGKSLAGVKLGMTRAQVFGQWGSTTCIAAGALCEWYGPGARNRAEVARVGLLKGKVLNVSIQAGTTGSNSKFKGGTLSAWRTAKGIRLGSKKSAVARAYPAAKLNDSEAVRGFDLFAGTSYTRFSSFGLGATPELLQTISVVREASAT